MSLQNVEVDSKDVNDPKQDNKIISQSVDPGETIDNDEKIKLVFGNAPGGANG